MVYSDICWIFCVRVCVCVKVEESKGIRQCGASCFFVEFGRRGRLVFFQHLLSFLVLRELPLLPCNHASVSVASDPPPPAAAHPPCTSNEMQQVTLSIFSILLIVDDASIVTFTCQNRLSGR